MGVEQTPPDPVGLTGEPWRLLNVPPASLLLFFWGSGSPRSSAHSRDRLVFTALRGHGVGMGNPAPLGGILQPSASSCIPQKNPDPV